MSFSRHYAREIAFQILYQWDLRSQVAAQHSGTGGDSIEEILQHHFSHFQTDPASQDFISNLVLGTLRFQESTDAALSSHLKKWKLDRIPAVDRNILRMAAFELLHDRSQALAVVINEAIELSKRFGHEQTAEFVNGVLASLTQETSAAQPK